MEHLEKTARRHGGRQNRYTKTVDAKYHGAAQVIGGVYRAILYWTR